MIERTIARRYAASLLRVSDETKTTEEVEALLLALKETFQKNADIRTLLINPRIPRRAKKAILRRALSRAAPGAFLRFLDLLIEKDRIGLLPHIADMFDELADLSAGVVRIEVRSYHPLSEVHERALVEKLTRIIGGKKLRLDKRVDPSLKGGMWVRIGDSLLDGSVSGRLKSIRERLLKPRIVSAG